MPAIALPRRKPLIVRKALRQSARIVELRNENAHSLLKSFVPKQEKPLQKFPNAAELEARRIASFNSKTSAAIQFVKKGYSAKDLNRQISGGKASAAGVLLMQGFGVRALKVLKFPEQEINSAVENLLNQGYSRKALEKRFGIPKSMLDKFKAE